MSMLSLIPEEKRKCYQRFTNFKRESAESLYSGNSRVCLLPKRKGATGSSTMLDSNHSLSGKGDRSVTQRVLSAKIHRVKQLQNQLSDAHYHLSELANENKMLRTMQKKQELALQRYENSNAELPKVLNAHTEELRVQQARFKQLKLQYKEMTGKLKEREMELQQLRDEHKHLLDLSKERNLPEREKLQVLVTELNEKVTKQNEVISMLQRKLTLEAKNYKHQLQMEIMKHKDTRQDLDLAITNADKLSSIIELKERMLNNGNGKRLPMPKNAPSSATPNYTVPTTRPVTRQVRPKNNASGDGGPYREEVQSNSSSDNDQMVKICENSRQYVSSALSHDDNLTSEGDTRSQSVLTNHSRTASSKSSRKNSKSSDENMIEIAKTVQDGMADLSIFREEIDFDNTSRDEIEKKITSMKSDLLKKIKDNEDPPSRMPSAMRKYSSDTAVEEHVEEVERPKSQGRKNSVSVSFKTELSTEDVIYSDMKRFQDENNLGEPWAPTGTIPLEGKFKSNKNLDSYCKGIMLDIEKSSKVIDQHMKEFSTGRFDSDKLVQQLETLDKMNDFVNTDNLGKIPPEALEELNNNFKMLTNQVAPIPKPAIRKRSGISSSKNTQRNGNAFGDASMSNQDLLNDLLGKK